MSRPVDMGLAERRTWIQYEQHSLYGSPFTLLEIVSYVLLGFLCAAILVLA